MNYRLSLTFRSEGRLDAGDVRRERAAARQREECWSGFTIGATRGAHARSGARAPSSRISRAAD